MLGWPDADRVPFLKTVFIEETCERQSVSSRSDPKYESKNSGRLLILNCESS